MSRNAFDAIEREQLRNDALRDQAKTEREAATCKHSYITTYVTEDGEPGGLWGCSVCNARFAPIANQIKAEQQRDELIAALDLHLPYVDQNNKTARGKSLAAIRAAIARVKQP